MVKQGLSSSGRSRVRLLYLEADLASGEIHELTSTLAGAVRPAILVTQPRPIPKGAGQQGNEERSEAHQIEFDNLESEELVEDVDSPPVARSAKPRKYRSPNVVADLDMKAGGRPFVDFVKEIGDPEEIQARFLISAYWLSEHAKIPTVSTDHIYTCYRTADWTFGVSDPGFPFRSLKRSGFGDTRGGQFTINHVGKARVDEMLKGKSR